MGSPRRSARTASTSQSPPRRSGRSASPRRSTRTRTVTNSYYADALKEKQARESLSSSEKSWKSGRSRVSSTSTAKSSAASRSAKTSPPSSTARSAKSTPPSSTVTYGNSTPPMFTAKSAKSSKSTPSSSSVAKSAKSTTPSSFARSAKSTTPMSTGSRSAKSTPSARKRKKEKEEKERKETEREALEEKDDDQDEEMEDATEDEDSGEEEPSPKRRKGKASQKKSPPRKKGGYMRKAVPKKKTQAPSSRKRSPATNKATPTPKAKAQPRKIQARAVATSTTKATPSKAVETKKRRAAVVSTKGDGVPPAPAALRTALTALAKRVLDRKETPKTSLVAALLEAYKQDGGGGKQTKKAVGVTGENETRYTPQLRVIARRVVKEHDTNPNKAQVDLFNLMFRSVGGTVKTNIDPEEVDLEAISNDEWTDLVTAVLEQMERTPRECVLLCADPSGAAHEAAAEQAAAAQKKGGSKKKAAPRSSVGAREYRKIYEEFWFQLGTVALTESAAQPPPSAGKYPSSDEDEGDEGDAGFMATSRFQVELAREILSRLIEIVGVGQPDIRAAATVAVYRMAVAMLERTVELKEKLAVASRQLAVARRSKMARKADALKVRVGAWNGTVAELEEIVKDTVMTVVFMKRYRDSNMHIRADSLRVLSQFTLIRPDIFVSGYYLKYFGWLLSDKAVCVRESAILGLLAPFREAALSGEESGINTNDMKSVIDKFLPRLADCAIDVNVRVQERAMELLLILSQGGFMDSLQDDNLWEQINLRALAPDTSPAVRRDALLFVIEQLEAFDSGSVTSEAKVVEQINAIVHWTAQTLCDSDIPIEKVKFELSDYVVHSLRSSPTYKPLVTNWTAMLRALEEGNGMQLANLNKFDEETKEANRLEVVQQRVLLRMLVCSAQQEAKSDPNNGEFLSSLIDADLVAARDAANPAAAEGPVKKRKQPERNSHEELTFALLRALPNLLLSFKSETSVMQDLTSLPQHFLSSSFNLSSRKKDFASLLSKLSEVFLEATDRVVLNNCVLALVFLAKGEHARSDEALLQLREITSSLRDRLLDLYEEKRKLSTVGKEDSGLSDTEHAISLCLRRLAALSKRWYLEDLLEAGEGTDYGEIEQLFFAIADVTKGDLVPRMANQPSDGDNEPKSTQEGKVWEKGDQRLHEFVADSVVESLDLLLTTTGWTLKKELDLLDTEEGGAAGDMADHIVVRMRDRLVKLLVWCFEQHIDDGGERAPERLDFAATVQEQACRITGDLRSLFPRQWIQAASPLLRACAFVEDSHLIGGYVRFLRGKDGLGAKDGEDEDSANRMLLPLLRGLSSNWKTGNRREAGVALTYITGSGQAASNLVSSASRVLKKIQPVRLLEAHMACLRQDFEDWTESEPEDLESDRPSEEEVAEFEEAEKKHAQQFSLIEQKAARLSGSLGVGKLRSLLPHLKAFVMEGIRFAFDTKVTGAGEDEEPLPLGARLPFLRILSKYMTWIRRENDCIDSIRDYLNQNEVDLRNDPEFSEVYEEDLETLAGFRRAGDLGEFFVEEESSTGQRSSRFSGTPANSGRSISSASFRRRVSHASSISSIRSLRSTSSHSSLTPVQEEDDGGDNANANANMSVSTRQTQATERSNVSVSTRQTRATERSNLSVSTRQTQATERSNLSVSTRQTQASQRSVLSVSTRQTQTSSSETGGASSRNLTLTSASGNLSVSTRRSNLSVQTVSTRQTQASDGSSNSASTGD